MDRPKAHNLNMICWHCKYNYTDEEAERTLGVKKVDTIDNENRPISAFVNTGNEHEKYHSVYCLKAFYSFMQMKAHDVSFHKVGDKMACSVPSGFIDDLPRDCGD